MKIPQGRDREHRDVVSQLEADESVQQAKAAEMSFDEQKTLAATKEDLKQDTTDIPRGFATAGACDSKDIEIGGVPLRQYIDTTVDVPVAKQSREGNTGTARLHDEVQQNPDGQEAAFSMSLTVKVGATCVSPCRRTPR